MKLELDQPGDELDVWHAALFDDPVVLWRLNGIVDDVSCVMAKTAAGFALGLRHGCELILAELYPTRHDTLGGAHALQHRLLERGWRTADRHH